MTAQATVPALAGAKWAGTARAGDWSPLYRRRLALTDSVVVLGVLAVAVVSLAPTRSFAEQALIVLGASTIWLTCLAAFDSRDVSVVAVGSAEYRAVASASFVTAGIVLLGTMLIGVIAARSVYVAAIPVGLVLLLGSRAAWRIWLHYERRHGRMLSRVLLVGAPATTAMVAAQLERHPQAGYGVAGEVALTSESGMRRFLADVLDRDGIDVIMVAASDHLDPDRIRALDRALLDDGRGIRLVFSPSVIDVAANRVRTHAAAGMPLVHVGRAPSSGPRLAVKRGMDIAGALLLIVLLLPVLLLVGLLVAVTSPGPVFYGQERVGRGGQTFRILKFRSMVVDADDRLATLLTEQGTEGSPLFKVEQDPRLTRIGAVLRRYSIDELPQLLNVLTGDMSLVGPRPQRPAEVALYDEVAMRRLAVRPGMTGLWQVSGRSRLTWEQALRLDLYYVENWSLGADIDILARTARAVVGSDGAY